jgi:uncharacterized damage-inducible protein DinB
MKPSVFFYPWKKIRKDLMSMLDQFDETEMDYVPFPGSWSVGKIFLHIAETEDYWIHYLIRKDIPENPHYELKEFPSIAAIRMKLRVAETRTQSFIDTLNEPDLDWVFRTPRGENLVLNNVLWHVLEHEIHHRGELSLILGLLGRKGLDV